MALPLVAEHLQIAQRTVYHWTQNEKPFGFKLGPAWRLKRDDRWIKEQKQHTKDRAEKL